MEMDITTIVGCKNRCKYCPQDKIIAAYKKNRNKIMSLKTFKTCLNKIPKNVDIAFAGMAEPFLNKDCMDMIEYTSKKGFNILVFTTTIGMKKKDIKRLEEIPLKYLEIHLPDSFNNTKIKIDQKYLEIVKAIKHSKIKNKHYQVFGEVHPKLKEIFGNEVEDLSRLIQNRAGNVASLPKSKKINGKIVCRSAGTILRENILLPNGDVILCSMDYGLRHKLGNLLKMSYEELFKTKDFLEIQKAMNSKSREILCRYCIHGRRANSLTYQLNKKLKKSGFAKFLYGFTKNKKIQKIYIWFMNNLIRKNKIKLSN